MSFFLAGLLLAFTGCSAVRQIDQWKCDTFGWCLPGIVPSYYHQYPTTPGTDAPARDHPQRTTPGKRVTP